MEVRGEIDFVFVSAGACIASSNRFRFAGPPFVFHHSNAQPNLPATLRSGLFTFAIPQSLPGCANESLRFARVVVKIDEVNHAEIVVDPPSPQSKSREYVIHTQRSKVS